MAIHDLQSVRNLIGRVVGRTCEPGTDHEAYELADAARELLAERDRLDLRLMQSRHINDELSAEVVELRHAVADIRRMAYAFDTPRDPGRVNAFVGDLRQIADKASRKDRVS